ncbi:hypothetical protein, partial [Corynebacterium diphtheriae]|uniref:hypothetical protein n=1 Tax=Corynebacterium diphtheriae TaxID=1717 RepID=UPI001A7E8E6F
LKAPSASGLVCVVIFFFKQKTANEVHERLVGSQKCIRHNPTEEVVPGTGVSQNDLDDLAHQLQQLLPGF